ncbi:RDD family protein [Kitasatospora purpeofusca]|uniref:RDD family protein n=1 Tax=Kitasatospora purpeofusca TaxID=67352 RepID=UPI002252FD1C|nr:RDD family protein [Kitasatospora purpeofusca]MCX4685757.1 RDD family protein [Kitasatospora purpeofusca]
MTDRPHAGGSTETAAGPAPGYYPDPSVPGFVRYWGGSAWVPGTSRAAPAEGEVLQPPRYATRRPAAAGAGVGARYVPPPVAAAPVPVSTPVSTPVPVSVQVPEPASGGDTGPVYLDRTAGGASFTFTAPDNGPVFRRGGEPVVADGTAGPAPDPVPEAPARAAPEPAGWQADPRAQRGLMETGSAPRWVSWGVLPGAEEPSGAVSAEAPAVAELSVPPAVPLTAPPAVPLAASASPVAPGADEPRSVPGPRVSAPAASAVVELPARPEPEAAPVEVADAVEAVEPPPAAAVPVRRQAAATGTVAATVPARASSPAPRRRTSAAPVLRPAGLGRRLLARLVDTAVLAVVAVAAGVPLGRSVEAHLQRKLDQARMASSLTHRQTDVWLVDGTVLGKVAVLLGILLFVGLLYEALPTARTGQTFGKRLARIRVVATARAGSAAAPDRPGLGRSLVRWLVGQVSALLVVGLLWPLFDRPARRGWNDRAARTRVVRL